MSLNHPAMSDAVFKYNILETLLEFLYEPVDQRHIQQLEDLIIRNVALMKASVRAFRYKGVQYRSVQAPRGPMITPALHTDLQYDMDLMLQEQEEIKTSERPMVTGFITTLLNASLHVDDYLLLLPDCLHPPMLALNLGCRGRRNFPTEAHAATFLINHQPAIQRIRERMATNLLFQF